MNIFLLNLLLAFFRKDTVANLLKDNGFKEKLLKEAIKELRGNTNVKDQKPRSNLSFVGTLRQKLKRTCKIGKIDPVIGRDEEIRRVLQILSRRTKNNPILVGEPGVGKTAIAEGLAHRIVMGDVPENLKSKQIYTLRYGLIDCRC
ncbi:MAG: hypothetical protein U5M51_09815 [Emticicia sp.]|nr:hypothetical protein [Emticicia sp.]